jgi:hypothetical protein
MRSRAAGYRSPADGGTLIDVALAVALKARWYRATGGEYRRMQERLGTRLTEVRGRS